MSLTVLELKAVFLCGCGGHCGARLSCRPWGMDGREGRGDLKGRKDCSSREDGR